MRSVYLSAPGVISVSDTSRPELKNKDDVLIRIAYVGVCGSDIHYYKTGRIGNQIIKYPFKVGHECSGTIEQTGENVKNLKIGDKVAIDPAVSCGKCSQCLIGRKHTCENLTFLGNPGESEGALSDYIVIHQSSCYLLPESLNLLQGCLIEPLTIGVYAFKMMRKERVEKIGILGAGPIGLSVKLAAAANGIKEIYMTDKLNYRLEIARKAGAVWTGNPLEEETSISPFPYNSLDAVFECCGEQEAIDQAVELLKPGGQLIIVGIPEVDRISFNIHNLRRKEISIQNVRRQNESVTDTINYLVSGAIDPGFMATHVFEPERTAEAFEMVKNYNNGVIKAVIKFN